MSEGVEEQIRKLPQLRDERYDKTLGLWVSDNYVKLDAVLAALAGRRRQLQDLCKEQPLLMTSSQRDLQIVYLMQYVKDTDAWIKKLKRFLRVVAGEAKNQP